MKHVIGIRRCGKSTTLAKFLLKQKGEVLYLYPSLQFWKNFMVPMLKELCDKDGIKCRYIQNERSFNTEKLKIRSIDIEQAREFQYRDIPKVIDEAGWYLEFTFGNVLAISSTGPNYNLDKKHLKWLKKIFKKEHPDIYHTDEFQSTWKLNEQNSKKTR